MRDACRDAIGALSSLYLKGGEGDNTGLGSVVVSLFVKPLFEAMSEQNKGVQVGAAMCMGKMVNCALEPPVGLFSKLCPRICKYLSNPNFLAKAALLPVVSSLSQVGAIAPQNLESLLHSIHDCLGSSDWATRKAAADTLSALALHSSNLIEDGASSMVTVLEACRFDKIKPVRDSMVEAMQLWKKIAKGGVGASEDQKASSHDGGNPESAELLENNDSKVPNHGESKTETYAKDSSNGSSPTDRGKGGNILDKAVGILKKKAPALTEKELNPEFFQRLETRVTDDLPVEVVVPRRCLNSASVQNEEESEPNDKDSRGRPMGNSQPNEASLNIKCRSTEKGNSGVFSRQRELDEFARDKWAEERGNGKDSRTNWLAIQRQLSQLERQQSHLMNMLQDFMGGSHDSMVTLENRVRGLERVVEDMVHDLSISTRRGSNFMVGFEGSSNRSSGKYNGFHDYGAKLGRSGDGWVPFGERYGPSDNIGSSMRGRGPSWRSDVSDVRDFHYYGKNGQMGPRRVLGGGAMEGRSPRSEHESDQVGNRRAWDKGEGPSARSVWQASKDEATLEAIRVAGDDNGTVSRNSRVAIPELTAEAMGDDNAVPERDPVWTSWSNAMDALHVGDMDSAYAEVLSTGDDLLLVKLMDKSGAVVDQLSNEVACEVLHAVVEFLHEPNLFDICLYWIQQLVDFVGENGPDVLGIPSEVKRALLVNLHEACSAVDPPEDWEGATPDQLLLQLASAWGINLQQLEK